MTEPATTPASTPLLEIDDVSKEFRTRSSLRGGAVTVTAVDRVSFDVHAGETVGVVGESGCGKSTLARIAMNLDRPTSGTVRFRGEDLVRASRRRARQLRRDIQIVFQDSSDSLSPRQRVADVLDEPLRLHTRNGRTARRKRSEELIDLVGLPKSVMSAYPHELSGGQRQRVSIARALSVGPKLLICDEPTSALDMSVQVQVMDLLKSLRRELNLTYLFISHDLDLVQDFSTTIVVMYLGQVVERARAERLGGTPIHPYTEGLLGSTLIPDPRIQRERSTLRIVGEIPSPSDPPSGCRFHPRCPLAREVCTHREPPLSTAAANDEIACHAVNDPEAMTGDLLNPARDSMRGV